MRLLYLAPRSNETAYKNYISSMQGVPKKNLERFLDVNDLKTLNDVDSIHAWGCQPSQESKWAGMKNGDYVMFYVRGKFVSVGELIFKKKAMNLL